MSRFNFPSRPTGHRLSNIQSNDLQQKLTYQQLLNLNHDLTKENMQLKNIGTRLGQELRSLHVDFEVKPRDESTELYHAIGSHPILHQYETTLIPLLDAYEIKIQEFEHGFEQIHEQFFALEKKFEQVCEQNEGLRMVLTQKIKELIEVYRHGVNENMQSDFGQLILEQINEKQRYLVEENSRLERDYQRYKSQAQKYKQQFKSTKQTMESAKSKVREHSIIEKQLNTQLERLKQSNLELQIQINQAEIQKRKLQQTSQRAQSQNSELTRQKQLYKTRLEELRKKLEKQNFNFPTGNSEKLVEDLRRKIAFLQAEAQPTDYPKRLSKAQKEMDILMKEKSRIQAALQSSQMREDKLNQVISDLKRDISKLNSEKSALEMNESRIKKSIQILTQKSKSDILKIKKEKNEALDRLENDLRQKISAKDKHIMQLEEEMLKVRIQRDKFEKENITVVKSPRSRAVKDSERTIEKLRQKLAINEQIFKEQIQIFQTDLSYLRQEADSKNLESKLKTDKLKELQKDYEELKHSYDDLLKEKNQLVSQFKRVRNEYEVNLNSKEKIFEEKIRQVKAVVKESEQKRRNERERVQEAAKQYKRILEDLKSTYESRISDLQTKMSESRYKKETTPY